jgi:hypothetical protein
MKSFQPVAKMKQCHGVHGNYDQPDSWQFVSQIMGQYSEKISPFGPVSYKNNHH